MKRLLPAIVAAASLLTALSTAADAAPWISINQRQAILEERINQGILDGSLTRAEAVVLRSEFHTLSKLETQYRNSGFGLSNGERQDLDRRFDALRLRVRLQKQDSQQRPEVRWPSMNERQARLYERIDQDVRSGALTRAEAIRMKGEFTTLTRLEAEYRRSGGVLTLPERAELESRLERLSRRLTIESSDTRRRR